MNNPFSSYFVFLREGAQIFAILKFKNLKYSTRKIITVVTWTNFKCFKPVNVTNGNYLSKVLLYSNKHHKENSNFNISSCCLQKYKKNPAPLNHFVLFLFTFSRLKNKIFERERQQNTAS